MKTAADPFTQGNARMLVGYIEGWLNGRTGA